MSFLTIMYMTSLHEYYIYISFSVVKLNKHKSQLNRIGSPEWGILVPCNNRAKQEKKKKENPLHS